MPHAFPAAAICGPRQLVPRAWAPLSDAEFAALAPWLAGADAASPGRRPSNLRRTLDAIFWVAASRGPWKDLPAELGKPDTASRALRRWARAGRLEPLLVKALHPDAEGCQALRGLGYWLARAFRRMARIVSTAALALVRDALCVVDAWPANPLRLPDRQLSETARKSIRAVGKALELNTLLFVRAGREGDAQEVEARWKTHRIIARTLRAGWRQLRLGVCGNRHQWRLR